MTNAADLKNSLKQIDKSDLCETIDDSFAARLGKPASDEEEE